MVLPYAIASGYSTQKPERGTEYSAGLDIFIPRITRRFIQDLHEKNVGQARKHIPADMGDFDPDVPDDLYVLGHSRIIIPTGIRFNIPSGTYLEVANRGSTAAKRGLIFGAHIIDEDYTGIVFINLINTTDKTITFEPGEKFVQLIHKEYIRSEPQLIDEDQLQITKRGDGALGSTNK